MPRLRIQPDSELTAFARKYAIEHDRADDRMLISHCRRFEALAGKRPIREITNDHVTRYREQAAQQKLSPNTTEKLLIDVRTIIKAATGVMLLPGRDCRWNIQPTKLVTEARRYIEDGGLRSNTLAKNCRRFYLATKDIFGDIEPADIQTEHIVTCRKAMRAANVSAYSIEKMLTDVGTVVRFVTGKLPDFGKRLRRYRPMPRPAPLDHIERVFEHSAEWFRQWLAVTCWTGARLEDSMKLQMQISKGLLATADVIRFQASKTGKAHVWPIPSWLRPWLKPVRLPYGNTTDHSRDNLRKYLKALCITTGVPVFTPKNMRQRAVTQWTRANGAAGAILHGKSLGVMDCYVDQEELLTETMPRVVMPKCFTGVEPGSQKQQDLDLSTLMNTLDANQRKAVVQLVLTLVGRAV